MLFNKKSEIDDLFDFNGVKMKTFTQWNRLRRGPMERTEIMKNVTLKDVAKAAGVSYATVSRALSGSNQIGKSTRERIVRLCDEMGYTGNYVARSMVMKKTYLLGLVVPAIENEFMSQLAYYVEMSARARGYNIMLCNSEPDLKQEEMVVKLLLGRRVDGILIVPQSPATYEKIAPLLEQIPAVFLSENLRDQPQSYVSVDNSRGAYLGWSISTDWDTGRSCTSVAGTPLPISSGRRAICGPAGNSGWNPGSITATLPGPPSRMDIRWSRSCLQSPSTIQRSLPLRTPTHWAS